MKKLVFMFVAMAAISFASCNETKPAQAVEEEVTDSVVADTVVAGDSVVADSVVAE